MSCVDCMENVTPSIQDINQMLSVTVGAGVRDLSPIGQGEWSSAYSYRLGDEAFIIRYSNLDEDFRKDAYAYRFSSPEIPIPEILQGNEGIYYIDTKK